jgi:PAS domain S-box-containing protein
MRADQTQALVLDVGDDAAAREALSRVLKLSGHTVIEASTGAEALRLARAERPDLVILDVHLTDMTGLEAVRELKADPATAAIPVLLLSAAAVDSESVVAGLGAGADACLTEPVNEAVLRATARTLVRLGRAQQEAGQAQAEAELRARQLEAVFEATSFPIIVYDETGTPVRANPAAAAAWGFDPVGVGRVEAARRRAMRYPNGAAVPPDELPTTRALNGEVVHGERYLFTDGWGEERVALHSVSPLRSGDDVQGAVAVWHDITEQDRAARERAAAYQQLQQLNEERELALEELQASTEELEVAVEELQVSQDQLQHEQARLRAVLDALPVSVAIARDADCRVIALNPAGAELYGVAAATNVSALAPPIDRIPVRHFAGGRELRPWELPMQRAAAEDREFRDVELGLLMPDGRRVTVLCNAVPIRDNGGAVTGAVATVTDITARKQAEAALRESEERYHSLFDGMTEGFALHEIICGEDGTPCDYRFLEVNPAFERLTGLRREEVVGRTFHEVLPGDDRRWVEAYGAVALTGEPAQFENYSPALGRHYEVFAYRPARGQFAVVFMDITARKEAEAERERLLAEVARQRTWFDTVLENTEALLVFLDRDFNFLHVNAAYARAGRKEPEGFLGHNHFEFYPHAENEAIFRRVRDTGEPLSVREKPFEYPDMPERGVTYWNWTLVPIRGETGKVEYLVFSLLDVTEQVRMRERLVEAERERAEIAERMTAEINHRMKNNLMLLTSVMQMQLGSLPPESAAAGAIQDAMARIASLSVVHEHLYQGQPGRVELRDVLRRVGDVVSHTLAAQRVAVTVSGPECYVSSKLGSTLAILANELITNAMKYGAPNGDGGIEITVSLAHEGGQLRLQVWNSGNPLAAGFDLARQSGMGLDLVQGVVTGQLSGSFAIRAHGGGTLAEMSFAEAVLDASHSEVQG